MASCDDVRESKMWREATWTNLKAGIDAVKDARQRARERVMERCRDGRASVFRCRGKLFVVAPTEAIKILLGERGADALLSLTVDDV